MAEPLYILAAALLCYLIGSFPTGYLFVKYFHRKDITKEGSGNVGTLNSFTVSRSRVTAFGVLIIDLLKGVLPIYFLNYFSHFDILIVYIGSVFIIIGHNYPVWLKFKGGRGLASAAGIIAVINFGVLVIWSIVWLIIFFFKKDILFSNLIATAAFPILVIILKGFLNDTFTIMFSVYEYNYNYFIIFVFIISILVLIKHREVFLQLRMKNEE